MRERSRKQMEEECFFRYGIVSVNFLQCKRFPPGKIILLIDIIEKQFARNTYNTIIQRINFIGEISLERERITRESKIENIRNKRLKRWICWFSRLFEILLDEREGTLQAVLAGREKIQVLDTKIREIAKILLVRHRSRVLQHRLRSCGALRSAPMADRLPL